jgi:hypothetical protein
VNPDNDIIKHTRYGSVKRKFRIHVLPILLSILIASCAGSLRSDTSAQPDQQYLKCRTVRTGDRQVTNQLQCYFGFEQCNLFTKTGKKLTVEAESGERLELFWTVDWFGEGRIIPRWLFVLYYVRPDGRGGWYPPVRIGECHFSEGCNHGEFFAPDKNGNRVPDQFDRIAWENWDYGDDDGEAGYLDHIRHLYVLETDRYTVTKHLYYYPDGCRPPLSPPEDVCLIRKECRPPYRLFKEEILETRRLFPTDDTVPPRSKRE